MQLIKLQVSSSEQFIQCSYNLLDALFRLRQLLPGLQLCFNLAQFNIRQALAWGKFGRQLGQLLGNTLPQAVGILACHLICHIVYIDLHIAQRKANIFLSSFCSG